MNSPFKMKYQGVPALLKKLVGNQDKLPENLKKAIEAAPESPAKSYGKSPMKMDPDPGKKKASSKTFSPVDGSVIPPEKYAERRAKSIAKQKEEKRYSMGTGEYEGTYVDTSSGKRYRIGEGPKSYGKSPVKSTGNKKKLGTEGMSYKEKVAYYEKQKKAKPTKNPKIRMGMGTSYTTIKK